jgi:hypothetical protein
MLDEICGFSARGHSRTMSASVTGELRWRRRCTSRCKSRSKCRSRSRSRDRDRGRNWDRSRDRSRGRGRSGDRGCGKLSLRRRTSGRKLGARSWIVHRLVHSVAVPGECSKNHKSKDVSHRGCTFGCKSLTPESSRAAKRLRLGIVRRHLWISERRMQGAISAQSRNFQVSAPSKRLTTTDSKSPGSKFRRFTP